ncbi:MAG: hypothetical protein K2X39_00350 [Silvanigrellaceae bacterium]|nr:hypothetical protein [Silvanigrellaceae bacterium]
MTEITPSLFPKASERLKYLRSILRLSRSYLQEKYNLPEVTLKSWENGTTPITATGAQRCVEAYRQEGLIVSEHWILEGIGLDPKMGVNINHYFSLPISKEMATEDDEVAMIREAVFFKESHSNAVIMMVSNDDMRPFYNPGDYIGGKIQYSPEKIAICVNKDCIVHLKNGERFFRRLIQNSKGQYNLTCINPNETTHEPVLYHVDIEGAAPVIWHRWKEE